MVVGLAGTIVSVAAIPFSSKRMTTERLLLALILLCLHVCASIAYYIYALHNPADSQTYYFDRYDLSSYPFSLGLVFVVKMTQFIKQVLGGSYFECFLLYQGIGFWGIVLLMRTFEDIEDRIGFNTRSFSLLLLFLPSLHFWTSAIGKDALAFFGISLCTWAMIKMRSRWAMLCFGLAVVLLVRPHVAFVIAASIAIAALLQWNISFGRKIGLASAALIGAISLIDPIQSTFSVDITDPRSFSAFFDDRNGIAENVGGNTTIGNASLVARFIALLFRPFFVDASNILGLIASVENLGCVLMFLFLLSKITSIHLIMKRVFFIRYCVTVSAVLIIILALFNYNVGTGLRERVMVFPSLLSFLVALWALSRLRMLRTAALSPPPLQAHQLRTNHRVREAAR